jgi:hypothetical protein
MLRQQPPLFWEGFPLNVGTLLWGLASIQPRALVRLGIDVRRLGQYCMPSVLPGLRLDIQCIPQVGPTQQMVWDVVSNIRSLLRFDLGLDCIFICAKCYQPCCALFKCPPLQPQTDMVLKLYQFDCQFE